MLFVIGKIHNQNVINVLLYDYMYSIWFICCGVQKRKNENENRFTHVCNFRLKKNYIRLQAQVQYCYTIYDIIAIIS